MDTPVTLGCPDHELSGEFLNRLHPPRAVPWRRPVWSFKTPVPEDYNSPVRDWLEHRQDLANQARANLNHVREPDLTRRNHTRRPATFKVGDLVLVHHSRLPTWPRDWLQDPYFGPYRIMKIDGSRIHVSCSPRLGGELLFAPKQLRHCNPPDELWCDERRLSDTEVERIDRVNAAKPEEADDLDEMTADEMEDELATTWLQVLHARSINRAGNFLPCGTAMGHLRQPGSPCLPLYSQMGVSTTSFVPTWLRTTRDNY